MRLRAVQAHALRAHTCNHHMADPNNLNGAILPLDPLCEVLSYLAPQDALWVGRVCRWWRRLVRDRDSALVRRIRANRDWGMGLNSMSYATSIGSLAQIEWLMEHEGVQIDFRDTACAALYGQLPLLQALRARCGPHSAGTECTFGAITCANAALGGHIHVLEWLRSIGVNGSKRNMDLSAALSGQLAVVQWVRDHGFQFTYGAIIGAIQQSVTLMSRGEGTIPITLPIARRATHSPLEILQWVWENTDAANHFEDYQQWSWNDAYIEAVKFVRTDVIVWLRDVKHVPIPHPSILWSHATARGVARLDCLIRAGVELPENTLAHWAEYYSRPSNVMFHPDKRDWWTAMRKARPRPPGPLVLDHPIAEMIWAITPPPAT
jgi:hypothetical protein